MSNENILTLDEFAARFAPTRTSDATPANRSIHSATQHGILCTGAHGPSLYMINLETGKLELHFDKADYDALSEEQKRAIKSAFLWGRKSGCWISRCKEPNLWNAKRVAESLGLTDGGKTGERLSFAEQQERKVSKAEHRAERFDYAATSAAARGEQLQKPINDMRGDIAFFTQPNINSSAGRAFTHRRDRMFSAFDRGFEEYRKSEYYRERAKTARRTADQAELKDKAFIMRRIRECESSIRKLKKAVDVHETVKLKIEQGTPVKRYNGALTTLYDVTGWLESDLDQLEAQLDKLGYYQDALDALSGISFSQENIKPGFIVKVQHWGECTVVSTGPKNFVYLTRVDGVSLTGAYAEIESIICSDQKPAEAHPFKVGDVFVCSRWNSKKHDVDKLEFRIIRATDKSVTLQTGNEKPFVRKPSPITWDHSGKWRLCITDLNDGTVYKLPNQ